MEFLCYSRLVSLYLAIMSLSIYFLMVAHSVQFLINSVLEDERV